MPVAYTARPAARLRSPQLSRLRERRRDADGDQPRSPVCDRPNHWKPGGRSCTHAPCVIQRRPSRSATIVASVTTIDGMRTHATSAPLMRAQQRARQARRQAGERRRQPQSCANTPAATLQIANCDPTEISICPRENDQRHAERHDQHRHVRQQQVALIRGREEARRDDRQHRARAPGSRRDQGDLPR